MVTHLQEGTASDLHQAVPRINARRAELQRRLEKLQQQQSKERGRSKQAKPLHAHAATSAAEGETQSAAAASGEEGSGMNSIAAQSPQQTSPKAVPAPAPAAAAAQKKPLVNWVYIANLPFTATEVGVRKWFKEVRTHSALYMQRAVFT